MNISNYVSKYCKKKHLSLTDFINYAKSQGYLVNQDNQLHWANEYREYLNNLENDR